MEMHRSSHNLAVIGALAFALLPIAAQAQWYSSYPRESVNYPYGAQQPYAVEVAPNTYVIHRPAAPRRDPSVLCGRNCIDHVRRPSARHRAERAVPEEIRPRRHTDPVVVEQLRRRSHVKRTVINTTKIVRDPPVVIVHKRVVDDPPRVIIRRHVEEAPPVQRRRREATVELPIADKRGRRDDHRIIRADAEVTILGPDRMIIRLFRKRHAAEADARAQ